MLEVTLCVWVENRSVWGKPTVWSADRRVVVLPLLPEDGGSRLVVNVGIGRSVILDRHLDVTDIRASNFT